MVRPGGVVADVGTDHAYLPVYLVNTCKSVRAIACDIVEGPLKRARCTVDAYGAADRVEIIQCDGLDGVAHADDVVIAGMGGELIAEIVGRCGFVRDARINLVLQPMTAQAELRKALCLMGFEIQREAVAKEGTKLYIVMSVAFTGEKKEPDELFCLTGLLDGGAGELEKDYLIKIAAKLRKIAAGLAHSSNRKDEAARYEALAKAVLQKV